MKDHNRLNAGIPQQVNQIYMIINESNPEGKNLDQISSFLINKIKDAVLQVVPYISTTFRKLQPFSQSQLDLKRWKTQTQKLEPKGSK